MKKRPMKTDQENIHAWCDAPIEDELDEMRLFPDFLPGSTASATESTGLIQVGIATPEVHKAYDDVYSYRQREALRKH